MRTLKETTIDSKALNTICVLSLVCILANFFFKIPILLYFAACFLFIGIFLKNLSAKISDGWLKFAFVLGTANSKLILTIVFFMFLTPIAILYRFFKHDPLNLSKTDNIHTNFVDRNHLYNSKDMQNIW